MNKIPLEIIALSSSVTQLQSYAVVLGEVDGQRKLPIVIGSFEAQSIAVALEQIKPSRPLTHDLMTNMMESYGITLQEVVIYRLSEGIFYANLVCEKEGEITEIDSRTSDAIALAIRNNCPIFTYENILTEASGLSEGAGIIPNIPSPTEEPSPKPKPKPASKPKSKPGSTLTHYTVDELKEMMQKALDAEDYDLAIQIRDELKNRGISE
jgi:bifunctional DNase/RNase